MNVRSILTAYSWLVLQKVKFSGITTKRKVNDYVILLAVKITKNFCIVDKVRGTDDDHIMRMPVAERNARQSQMLMVKLQDEDKHLYWYR